jgi:hypothetical protein
VPARTDFGVEPDEIAVSLYGRPTAEAVRELAGSLLPSGGSALRLVLVDLSAIDPKALAGCDLQVPAVPAPAGDGGVPMPVRAWAFVAASDGAQRAATLFGSHLGEHGASPRRVFGSRVPAIEWLRQQRNEPAVA